jgi:glycosyltransferase involved in cell wall biosynthesis
VSLRVVVALTCGSVSGVDVFSTHLVRSLRARGVSAHILLTQTDHPWNALAIPDDVPQVRLPVGPHARWHERWDAMSRYLESLAPCVYLPNYDYNHSCVSPRLSRQVSVVGIVHSDDPVHYEHVTRLGRFWDAVVAVSPEIAETTAERLPSLGARLATIPYGIPMPQAPRRARTSRGTLEVVYAGRLDVAQKRVMDLPLVFEQLVAAGIPARLTILGDGPARGLLEQACALLVAAGSVRLLGARPNGEVLRAFESADAVVLPSAFEGLPVCLIEAMARGCVPVVSDVRSGVSSLVRDGIDGFRVPVGDVGAFAARLTALQRENGLLERLSVAAARTVAERRLDLDTMTDRYVALFEEVRANAKNGRFQRPAGAILPPPGLHLTWRDSLPRPVGRAVSSASRFLRAVAMNPAAR